MIVTIIGFIMLVSIAVLAIAPLVMALSFWLFCKEDKVEIIEPKRTSKKEIDKYIAKGKG